MDLSPEYIKMCGKAEEIQTLTKKNPSTLGRYIFDGRFCTDEHDRIWLLDNEVWLPRQDQLQDMIFDKLGTRSVIITNYTDQFTIQLNSEKEKYSGKSLEQCWLMLVMDKLYKKKWDCMMSYDEGTVCISQN